MKGKAAIDTHQRVVHLEGAFKMLDSGFVKVEFDTGPRVAFTLTDIVETAMCVLDQSDLTEGLVSS